MKRIAVLAAALVVLFAAGGIIASRALRRPAAPVLQASGTIEATQADVAPKVSGRLLALLVADGKAVRKGEQLAVLDRVEPAFNQEQSFEAIRAAQAQVALAQAAYDYQSRTQQTDLTHAGEGVAVAVSNSGQAGENLVMQTQAAALHVDQAQAQLDASRAAFARAAIQLQRERSLVKTGDEPQQLLDDAENQYRSARSEQQNAADALRLAESERHNVRVSALAVQSARSQYRQSLASMNATQAQWQIVEERRAALAAAQAQLAQARAAFGIARNQNDETILVAPFDGVVVSHNFEVGDLIDSGSPVLTIADLRHPYLYVYVGETDLPRVKNGALADVHLDGMPGRSFTGRVTEIATDAEFTPENVQTTQERIEYLVFRVKVQFTDTSGLLKPGLPADAALQV